MSGGSKSQVTGHRYYFGIHMGIGRGPVDSLNEVKVGDRRAWIGSVTGNTTIDIDAYNLFGGEDKEGGVQGPLEVMMGEADQTPSSGLLAMLGSPLSGFRRMFTVFFNGLVSMNNPYPKAWAFRFNRILKGWDGEVFQPTLARIPVADSFTAATELIRRYPLTAGIEPDPGVTVPMEFGGHTLMGLNTGLNFSASGLRHGNINSFDVFYSYGASSGPTSTLGSISVAWTLTEWEQTPTYENEVVFFMAVNLRESGLVGIGSARIVFGFYEGVFQFYTEMLSQVGTVVDRFPLGVMSSFSAEIKINKAAHEATWFIDGSPRHIFNYAAIIPSGAVLQYLDWESRATLATPGVNLHGYRIRNVTFTRDIAAPVYSMNPAHIIFECLTNREWGRGLARAKIDQTSFTVAAQRLYNESFGMCIKWTRKDSISSFVQVVLDHIGGALYQNRMTGLMTLKLIRDDYDPDLLPTYDTENGLLEVKPTGIGSAGSAVNAITVKWHDPLTDEDRTVSVKSTASILRNGGAVNSASKDYQGAPTAALALRLAQRDLRASSTSLRRFTVVADRSLDHLHPGEVFALRDNARGVPRTVVRIGKANYGTLVSGKVTFEVVQDVFALPDTTFAAEVPKTYTPPDTRPCVDEQRAMEAPYFLLAGRMSPSDFDYVKENGGYFVAMASKGKPINMGVEAYVRQSAPTPDDVPPNDDYVCGI